MPPQHWASKSREDEDSGIHWRQQVQHKPLRNRTTDPEAADLDEAVTLFRSGLRHARGGQIELGLPQIACAYLLDARAIQFRTLLPDRDREDARYYVMDMNLLQDLIDHDGGNNFASQVLMIFSAIRFGHAQTRAGQMRVSKALTVSDRLIQAIQADPTIETPARGILGGCLKRTTLHGMRCSLFTLLGNRKKAIQELTAALKLDSSLASVRCSRACLYASLEDKDGEVAVQEFRRTVTDCHPDSSDLPVAYAWLAKILLENKNLGTYELAETYWKKSRQAAARYTELYGKVSKSAIEDEMKELFGAVDPLGSVVESWEKEGIGNLDKSRGCFACGRAASVTGGNLLRSSQCRNEFYCSSQCQQDDWPDHKATGHFVQEEEPDVDSYFDWQTLTRCDSSRPSPRRVNKSESDGFQHRTRREPCRNIPRVVTPLKAPVDYNAHKHRSEDRRYQTPPRIHWDEPLVGPLMYENQGSHAMDEDAAFYRESFEERNHRDDEEIDDAYPPYFDDDDPRDAPHDRFHMSHDDYGVQDDNNFILRRNARVEEERFIASRNARAKNDNFNASRNTRAEHDNYISRRNSRVEDDNFAANRNSRVEDDNFIARRSSHVEDDGFIANRNSHVESNNWKGGNERRGVWLNRRIVPPKREPHIGHGLNFTRPTRILKDHEGQELANRTIRDYLVFRFEEDGPRFSCWWYHLSTVQRTDILNVITQNTIPVVPAKLPDIALLLKSGGPRHGARVLTDFSLKTILCPCSCSDEECLQHDYRDQLLHDLHYYVMCWDVAEEMEYQFCVKMVHQGMFPDRSCRDGMIKFVEPPMDDDPLQLHQVVVMNENAPRRPWNPSLPCWMAVA
ncbi:hypothetical protein MHU86_1921 [Fragilaria crotonensis]|nr:hypothetical protein MHU86_1921 [Fragilaria crotonensis]